MLVIIKDDYAAVSEEAGRLVADRLRKKPSLVLGLATGSTPLGLYRELIRMHADDGLDFSKATTFNLDEYVGLPPDHPQSYNLFMHENLFSRINADARFIHIPNGMVTEIEAHCEWYEDEIRRMGGIDLQVLGIGANGHIAFNEPGSSLGSRTRVKTLSRTTREDNARFFPSLDEVPRHAITMGIGTIMEAREILLIASGEGKAVAIQAAVEGALTATAPASMIQMHPKAFVIVDQAAASRLSGEHATTMAEAVLSRRRFASPAEPPPDETL